MYLDSDKAINNNYIYCQNVFKVILEKKSFCLRKSNVSKVVNSQRFLFGNFFTCVNQTGLKQMHLSNDQFFDPDYDFTEWIKFTESIFNESITINELLLKIRQSVGNDKDLRDIIHKGIDQYYKKTKNFSIIKDINRNLKPLQQPSNLENSRISNCDSNNDNDENSNNSHCKDVFNINELQCLIFQHLNFETIIDSCSLVCKTWLHGTYDENCFTNITLFTERLYKVNFNTRRVSIRFSNLSRFKKIKSIIIDIWPPCLSQYFNELSTKFNKIESILVCKRQLRHETRYYDFDGNFGHSISKLLKSNADKMKNLEIEISHRNIVKKYEMDKMLNNIVNCVCFNKLDSFSINAYDGAEEPSYSCGFPITSKPCLKQVYFWYVRINSICDKQ